MSMFIMFFTIILVLCNIGKLPIWLIVLIIKSPLLVSSDPLFLFFFFFFFFFFATKRSV